MIDRDRSNSNKSDLCKFIYSLLFNCLYLYFEVILFGNINSFPSTLLYCLLAISPLSLSILYCHFLDCLYIFTLNDRKDCSDCSEYIYNHAVRLHLSFYIFQSSYES